jgi:hypothetical protein
LHTSAASAGYVAPNIRWRLPTAGAVRPGATVVLAVQLKMIGSIGVEQTNRNIR